MTATSGSDQAQFTPETLKDVAGAPVFWLRPMTGRILPRYRHALTSAGLQFHNPGSFREEMLRALPKLWTPADFEVNKGRLQAYWDAADRFEEAVKQWRAAGAVGEPPELTFDREEARRVAELQAGLVEHWPRLAIMTANNKLFLEESPRVAASMVLAGWSGIDVPFALDAGVVPMATIDAVEDALEEVEQSARGRSIAVGEDGTAFMELIARCLRELNLSGDEEKNSPSPSPAPSDPNGSTTKPSEPTEDARSQASASSEGSTQPA